MEAEHETRFFILENRLASFQSPQPVAAKRKTINAGSSRAPKTLTWPHRSPSAMDLARAGFYFNPQASNPDNVKCFLCHKDLDGWEEDDNPLQEHLKHSSNCGWAICAAVELELGDVVSEDPRLPYLLEARKATFAGRWPYESRKGWKCKTKQLAEAGWQYTPTLESDDNTTCAYCQLALDGWEAGDKPMEEHQKRAPNCAFFALISKHPAPKKTTSRGKAARTSKASRLSVQSVATQAEEEPSMAEPEDSILTATSVMTQGGRKAPRGRKAAATTTSKARKSRVKKDEPVEVLPDVDVEIVEIEEAQPLAPKAARGKKRHSDEMETAETSVPEAAASKKKRATRGRVSSTIDKEAGRQTSSDYAMFDPVVPDIDEAVIEAELRALEREMEVDVEEVLHETREAQTAQVHEVREVHVPKKGQGRKTGTRKVSKQQTRKPKAVVAQEEAQPEPVAEPMPEPEPAAEPEHPEPKHEPKKTKAKAKTKKATPQPAVEEQPLEDSVISAVSTNAEAAAPKRKRGRPSKKSLEARASLEAAAAAAVSAPTPAPVLSAASICISITPIPLAQRSSLGPVIEPTPVVAAPAPAPAPPKRVTRIPPPVLPTLHAAHVLTEPATPRPRHTTPRLLARQAVLSPSQSPQSSDAENQPPSSRLTASAVKTRVALAPVQAVAATPVRSGSPSKRGQLMGGLRSTVPWTAVDVETIFDSDKENDGLEEGLFRHGTELNTPEKAMTVEEFILYNAAQAERQLKEECEAMVSMFERQGTRAMQALEGLMTEE